MRRGKKESLYRESFWCDDMLLWEVVTDDGIQCLLKNIAEWKGQWIIE